MLSISEIYWMHKDEMFLLRSQTMQCMFLVLKKIQLHLLKMAFLIQAMHGDDVANMLLGICYIDFLLLLLLLEQTIYTKARTCSSRWVQNKCLHQTCAEK